MIDNDKAAIYARFSTDRQDARSIDDQTRRCREFAVRSGFTVVAEFSDAAMSGAHTERVDLRRMMTVACSPRPPFKTILVDDLSRLSRDLGATWRMVFEDLASAGVRVFDVSTGMASDGAGTRLTFGAMALVNDVFLQLVRTETHRGLEGRALAGFWTGGRIFGYATLTEENPADVHHPRKVPVVKADEATIIRRVFALFVDGHGYKSIADVLNRDGIAAPHDDGKGNKIGRGWGHTSIRNMLMNERYVGRWTWSASKWVRVPGKKSRRRIRRQHAEHVVREFPHLTIIDAETWAKAQASLQRRHRRGGGRPAGSGKHGPYLTSGLLRCGSCGGSMSIVGAKSNRGVRYATFGCLAHHSRGGSICGNDLTISERKITMAVLAAVRDVLTAPGTVDRIIDRFQARLAEAPRTSETEDVETQIAESERRVRNLTEGVARSGIGGSILDHLAAEETRLADLRGRLAALTRSVRPAAVPPADAVRSYLANLGRTLGADPVRGRELLARHITPIVLTPKTEGPDRHYVGSGAFNPSPVLEN